MRDFFFWSSAFLRLLCSISWPYSAPMTPRRTMAVDCLRRPSAALQACFDVGSPPSLSSSSSSSEEFWGSLAVRKASAFWSPDGVLDPELGLLPAARGEPTWKLAGLPSELAGEVAGTSCCPAVACEPECCVPWPGGWCAWGAGKVSP
uniref:Putative secreted protein n=1 Tax=Ixodes ricinus TaxID=34613 RepID=A0A6B0UUP7_IXORI